MTGTIFDYLEWRGDIAFSAAPFNEVDNLIISVLAYLPFDGLVPAQPTKKSPTLSDVARNFAELDPASLAVRDGRDVELLARAAESRRFGATRISGYVNSIDVSEQKQFSAVCAITDDGTPFVAFRGTDLTLVGWKEDLNMGFMSAVPSQLEAVAYLENAARRLGGKFRVGGHSKGGNLAAYAAAFCAKTAQKRISAVFSNDGPGFSPETIESEGFRAIQDRTRSLIPQSSVIGLLLEHSERYSIVHSEQSGLLQHDPYSWTVVRDRFVPERELTRDSVFVDRTLKDWIRAMDTERRKTLIDALYEIIGATEAETVLDLSTDWLKTAKATVKSLSGLDAETKKILRETLGILFEASKKNLDVLRREKKAAKTPNVLKPSTPSARRSAR